MFEREILKKYKINHIVLWCVLLVGWYLLRSGDFPNNQVAAKITIVKVLVLAFLVYLTNEILIPFLLYKKRYWLFGLLFTMIVCTMGIVKISLIMQLLQPYYRYPLKVFDDIKERFYDNIIPLFLLVSTGAAAKLVTDYISSEKKLAAISREKAETELQYLKSQLNPHFVFNTLNAIYFQIDKSNHDARESLLQFADLLRYQLYECNAETITIEKEMQYLEDYIHLQKKRKDSNYKVTFKRCQSVRDFQIVPLLLIPFVENAFKHISHYSNKLNIIVITASRQDDTFAFNVINSVELHHHHEPKTGGIGLRNVQRRLDMLYAGKHTLRIEKTGDHYTVDLQIKVNNS
ncbi:MAG: histidine kinase [Chitinophagaceae bacterium]